MCIPPPIKMLPKHIKFTFMSFHTTFDWWCLGEISFVIRNYDKVLCEGEAWL